MKRVFLLLLFFVFSKEVLASSAKSVVETRVEGEQVEVYQSVEATVNGETIKKESREPGRLELEMRKESDQKPTVTFSQEPNSSPASTRGIIVSSIKKEDKPPSYLWFTKITSFFQSIWLNLTKWLKR